MSFPSIAARAELDRLITIEASADNFATTLYRWSDNTLEDTTNGVTYDGRILSLGDIARSLGVDRVATSASASLELDNTDGALDALMTGDSFASLRFRVNIIIWDNSQAPVLSNSKRLGEFSMQSPAQERAGRISIQLGDDMMTRIGAGLQLPTFRDWSLVGTTSNNPLKNSTGVPLEMSVGLSEDVSYDTPIQLAFGEDWLQCLPHVLCPYNSNYTTEVIVPLYSTVDLTAVSQSLVDRIRVEWVDIDSSNSSQTAWRDLPRTIPTGESSFASGSWGQTVWLVEKSPTITKNGINFQVVYLRIQTHLGIGWPARQRPPGDGSGAAAFAAAQLAEYDKFQAQGGYLAGLVSLMDFGSDAYGKYYRTIASRVLRWYVMAAPKSQITNAPALGSSSHAVDIATDLVTQYLPGTVDATSAARVKAGNPNAAATGVVHPWTERQNYEPQPGVPNTLRQVMTKLAQSADIDFFINWAGQLAFASDVWAFLAEGGDAAITALASYDETDVTGGTLERWIPTEGERWAPFNRVYLEGAKDYPPEQLGIAFQGPYDLSGQPGIIPTSTRVLETTLTQGWRPFRQQQDTPLNYRQADGSSRWKVRFTTHLLFLQHDLGDYFRLTWRRDSGQPALYDGTVFQIEGLTFSPSNNSVTVEAVWRDDARTTRQYLLDDERYFDFDFGTTFDIETESGVVLETESGEVLELESPFAAYVYSSGGRTWVTTQAGDSLSGLFVGDLFVTKYNASTPSPAWQVGVWRIDQIDTSGAAPGGNSAIRLVAHPDGTLPASSLPQTIPGTDWFAQHSPLTLANLANHPNGVRVYGCATNSSGQLSDNSLGNKLLNG